MQPWHKYPGPGQTKINEEDCEQRIIPRNLTNIKKIVPVGRYTIYLTYDGKAVYGFNGITTTPKPLMEGVKDVFYVGSYVFLLTETGQLMYYKESREKCRDWTFNFTPVLPETDTKFVSVSAGVSHLMAVTKQSTVYAVDAGHSMEVKVELIDLFPYKTTKVRSVKCTDFWSCLTFKK